MIKGGREKFKLLEETYATSKAGLRFFSYHIPVSKQSKDKIRKEISKKIIQGQIRDSDLISSKKKEYFNGDLEVELNFGLDKGKRWNKRTDIDNLIKHTLDCLTGILFKDDSQIIKIYASKYFVDVGTIECTGIRINKISE